MSGRSGNGPGGQLAVAVDPEDVGRLHLRVDRPLIDADELEVPVREPLAGRRHGVQLGQLRPDVMLVELRGLHHDAVLAEVLAAHRHLAEQPVVLVVDARGEEEGVGGRAAVARCRT